MEIYRKNNYISTKQKAIELLTAHDDFINKPVSGKAPPNLDGQLLKIWNGGERLTWEWEDETQEEYDRRIEEKVKVAESLALLKSDNVYFKNTKIRPWRDQKLREWIDDTFQRPLLFNLKTSQEQERIKKREELLDWPALNNFTSYKTDTEIDALKPDTPSWIS